MFQRAARLVMVCVGLGLLVGCQPKASFTMDTDEGPAPLTVKFTDTSSTRIPFLGSVNSIFPVRSWEWDFGDGFSSDLRNPEHTYTEQGAYDVTLTVTTRLGSGTERRAGTVKVIGGADSPRATFTSVPRTGVAPLTVQFTDTTQAQQGAVLSREWDFGDRSAVSTEQNPSHVYQQPGVYTVTLTLRTTTGTSTVTKEDHILVAAAPRAPQANFTEDRTQGAQPATVKFTDLSEPGDAAITAWEWFFGDGETSTLQNPTHVYETAGTYTVTLTVRTALGTSTRRKENLIRVLAPPE